MNLSSDFLTAACVETHAHATPLSGLAKQYLKLSLRQGHKGQDLHAALEGRAKFPTQAWPYLAAGALKGLELKFEMIEREWRRGTATGMFIGCSWATLKQYGPGLDAGTVCVSLFACVHTHVYCTSVCLCGYACERGGMRYWVNTDQSLDISRYMCLRACLCRKKVWGSCVPVCLHAVMCVSDSDIRAIWKSLQ